MFDGFRGFWTPATIARRIGRDPVRVVVAGTAVALFRDRAGVLHGLIDRCPHRGAALSAGTVGPDGGLACPFHGWTFDGAGACTHVPWNDLSAEARERLRARAVPTAEAAGLAWIFTEPDAATVPPLPTLPESLTAPGFARYLHEETWATHWTRAMENMLDAPHLPFVHRGTIGRFLRRPLLAGATLDIEVEPTEHGFRTRALATGQTSDPGYLDWYRPNGMVLTIPVPGRVLRQHVWCVPAEPGRVRMILVSARNFGVHNPLLRLFDRFNLRVLAEDRRVLETCGTDPVPPASDEASVRTDKATLRFRAWWTATQARPQA